MRKLVMAIAALMLLPALGLVAQSSVKFSFWHVGTADVDRNYFQGVADAYMKAHPNVTIEITVLENEAFKAKLATVLQSGNPPDLFQSWGGGVMKQQAEAGMLRDITKDVAGTAYGKTIGTGVEGVYQANGKQYGMPYDMGAVTFWYTKDFLAKVGYKTFPATWADLLTLIGKLKAAGITPWSVGAADKWPTHFIWTYLAIQLGGKAAFDAVLSGKGKFTDAPFLKASQMLADLAKLKPFQDGFLGTNFDNESALVGNGKAAFDLMGQWGPGNTVSRSISGKGVGASLAMAPFPAVAGGVGKNSDVLGGGNGLAVGKNAPDAAIDFLKFLTNKDNNAAYAAMGRIIPVVIGADAAITDANNKLVKSLVDKATYYQLYLDQFFPPAVGGAINDAVQTIVAGTATPAQAVAAIQRAWEENK